MKLLTLATLLASATATIVYPYESSSCRGSSVGRISACGCTNMGANYDIRAVKLNFQQATASFYKEKNCVGVRFSKASDQSCAKPPVGWGTIGSRGLQGILADITPRRYDTTVFELWVDQNREMEMIAV
ncbi:predicted protein [Uncinocarpus reesii 1704]|uniref:Uncharacterized protein n=1 Tax=Uncinocarpus reesii (strain UAMH 1704) TaxID=336963 RepID=C4JS23_UNCRE|nr:uncharacterized protein UREG_05262 [Uncinocarpus reesii 1704]EEP80420.1 predicted protein [Uncinocarpus reesii 1704]